MRPELTRFLAANWFKLAIAAFLGALVFMYWYQTFVVLPAKESAQQRQRELRADRLQDCLADADRGYALNWQSQCRVKFHEKLTCSKRFSKDVCDSLHSGSRSESDCSLPIKLAESLATERQNDRAECHKTWD